MQDIVANFITFNFKSFKMTGRVGKILIQLVVKPFREKRIIADVQVSNCLLIHRSYDTNSLVICQAHVS